MKNNLQSLKKFPIVIAFLGFLFIFSFFDTIFSNKKVSELENRTLAQAPAFTFSAFIDNQWTKEFGEYTKDQFIFRDEWISTHSLFEAAQGKLESNGVWYGQDRYQIAKNDIFTASQQRTLPQNVEAVSQLAARYPGKVSVMVVPSPANMLSGKLRFNPPQMDENGMLDTMFSTMAASGASVIDLRPVLTQNLDTQLYYRTDHHWTTNGGARLAYEAFCQQQGIAPIYPPETLLRQQPDFKGTNFAKTKFIFTQPEVIDYYDLPNNLRVFKFEADGTLGYTDGPIMDTAKFETFDKYGAFLRGNNGYSELTGNGEGSIIVFKDSFGNAFIPYLVENYAKIGIVDLRSWHTVDQTINEGEYDEILVLYSFPSFIQDGFVYRMMDANQEKQG